MKIVSFCSFKGGTAKTTLSINIGCNISQLSKRRVLLIDLDPQANLTSCLGVDCQIDLTFNERFSVIDHIKKTKIENLDILPSSVFFEKYRYFDHQHSHFLHILQTSLQNIKSGYDLCIIDTPPSVGMLTREIFTISNHIVICLTPEPFSVLGLQKIKEMSCELEKNDQDWVLGVAFSFWDSRNATNNIYENIVNSIYPDKIFKSKIRKDVNISRALLKETSVLNAFPQTRSVQDFINLSYEIEQKLFQRLVRDGVCEKLD